MLSYFSGQAESVADLLGVKYVKEAFSLLQSMKTLGFCHLGNPQS